jgi:hypothetical protein
MQTRVLPILVLSAALSFSNAAKADAMTDYVEPSLMLVGAIVLLPVMIVRNLFPHAQPEARPNPPQSDATPPTQTQASNSVGALYGLGYGSR